MLNLTESSEILDRIVNLHQDKSHIDLMVVATGEIHRLFGGRLIKTETRTYRHDFDIMEVQFLFQKPFDTEFDEDGDYMAPTEKQLAAHNMKLTFSFNSGRMGDYIGGCRMADIFIRNSGVLQHKHIRLNETKQIPCLKILEWAQKIDLAERASDKERARV